MSRYTKSMTDALRQVDDRTQEFDEEVKWEVKITGLPTFYSDGKSRGEVKQALRKLLKRPDDIVSIERTSPAALKKIRRGQAAGTEPGDEEEAEKVKEEVKINRIIKAQNEALNVDDIVNMIQFGHPFKVAEDIPAELPPGPDIPKYKDVSNATVDKEDKKANKVKNKIEKEVLKPTQTEEGKLPSHLSKFLDKKGNPNKEAQARIDAGRKKRAAAAAKPKITDVTPKGYGPSDEEVSARRRNKDREASMKMGAVPGGRAEEVELAIMSLDHKEAPRKLKITQQGLDALRKDRDKPRVKTQVKITKQGRAALEKDKKNQNKDPVGPQHEMVEKISRKLREVAPPGWGHTKAEKSKTHPEKPKSKIGGSIEAMKKAQARGDIPKDMNIFALAWSMKNKGDKPHYKPGEKDVLKKKYKGPKGQNEEHLLDSAKRYVIDERADWETAFKSASQSRPAMKYKDAVSFIENCWTKLYRKKNRTKIS